MAGKTSSNPEQHAKKAAAGGVGAKAARPGKASANRSDPLSASSRIDAIIAGLGDWRGETLSRVRALIKQVDPNVVEEVKWIKPSNPAGVPVWSHDGMICTGETYKDKVKFTFAHGAALEDPARLFNAGFGGNTRRAIDLGEGDRIDKPALKALLREAVAYNSKRSLPKSKGSRS